MYLISFPLLLLPFAFFNIVVFLLNIPLSDPVFTIPLMSTPAVPPVFDRSIAVTTGDLIVAIGMLLLYVEVVKAARPGGKSIIDPLLALIYPVRRHGGRASAGAAGSELDLVAPERAQLRRCARRHLDTAGAKRRPSCLNTGTRRPLEATCAHGARR